MPTQQQKEIQQDIELDFFKKTSQKKPFKKSFLKQAIAFTVFLQAASIISYVSEMRTHLNHMQVEVVKTLNTYTSYQEHIRNKNYKEATYKLNGLFTQETAVSNFLALTAVNVAVFNSESKYPDNFIKEGLELAKQYHHKGAEAEIMRDSNIKPCWEYDLVCQAFFYPMKKALTSYDSHVIKRIDEYYYQLNNIKEYKAYYKNPEWINNPSPYQLSGKEIPF